jgi:hypothetical protein
VFSGFSGGYLNERPSERGDEKAPSHSEPRTLHWHSNIDRLDKEVDIGKKSPLRSRSYADV